MNFNSGWWSTTHLEQADINIECAGASVTASGFVQVFLETTMMRLAATDYIMGFDKRENLMCVFSKWAELEDEIEGPRFVFAHILSPHAPFVFGSTFVDEVMGIESRIRPEIDKILEGSDNPPIIVIQGDHGAPSRPRPISELTDTIARQRLGILNAYHLPGDGNDLLYPSITPVNTFRLIFDYYFGATYDLLEDRSYYYDERNAPYKFADVTDIVHEATILEQ